MLLKWNEKLKKEIIKMKRNFTYSSVKSKASWKTCRSLQESRIHLIGQYYKDKTIIVAFSSGAAVVNNTSASFVCTSYFYTKDNIALLRMTEDRDRWRIMIADVCSRQGICDRLLYYFIFKMSTINCQQGTVKQSSKGILLTCHS